VYDGIHDLLGFVVSDRHGIIFGVGWCACVDVNPIESDFVLDIKFCSIFVLQRKIQSLIVFGLVLFLNSFRTFLMMKDWFALIELLWFCWLQPRGRHWQYFAREFGDIIAPYVILQDPNHNEIERMAHYDIHFGILVILYL
jgi:hypothetical protein